MYIWLLFLKFDLKLGFWVLNFLLVNNFVLHVMFFRYCTV